jgi:hypothetical protein
VRSGQSVGEPVRRSGGVRREVFHPPEPGDAADEHHAGDGEAAGVQGAAVADPADDVAAGVGGARDDEEKRSRSVRAIGGRATNFGPLHITEFSWRIFIGYGRDDEHGPGLECEKRSCARRALARLLMFGQSF